MTHWQPRHRDLCSVPLCEEERAYNDGLCRKHHSRFERSGTTDLIRANARAIRSNKARNDPINLNVEALRLRHNWSPTELAYRSGLSVGFMYRINDPSLNTLRALGAAFNVDYWRLLIPGEFTKEST